MRGSQTFTLRGSGRGAIEFAILLPSGHEEITVVLRGHPLRPQNSRSSQPAQLSLLWSRPGPRNFGNPSHSSRPPPGPGAGKKSRFYGWKIDKRVPLVRPICRALGVAFQRVHTAEKISLENLQKIDKRGFGSRAQGPYESRIQSYAMTGSVRL